MKKIVVTTMAFLSLGVASLGTKAHADETNQANTMPKVVHWVKRNQRAI